MQKIEVIVDSLSKINGMLDPESPCYRIKNPLMLRSFARPGKHPIDGEGRRVFDSLLAGYRAALYDVELKVRGLSRAKLKPEDPFYRLLAVYEITEPGGISNVVSFVKRALNDQTITKDTPLSYFLEK